MINDNQNNFSNELNPEFLDYPNSNQELNESSSKKKKSINIILVVLGVLIIALVIFLIYYTISMKKPEKVFNNITNYMFNSVENLFSNSNKINLEETGLVTGNLKINTTIEEYDFLDNAVFNYNLGYDIKNKKAELGFGYDEDNQKVMFAETEIKDNNLYFYLDDLFDKVILMDNETIQNEFEININDIFTNIEEYLKDDKSEDILYIIKQLHLITNKVFENVKYETLNEKLNVNNKEINTTKMVLNLNKENMSTMLHTYIDEILKNDELLTKIANLLEIEKNELTDEFKSMQKEIDSIEEPTENVKLSIYTTGLFGNIVKIAYEIDNEEIMYYVNHKEYKLIYLDEYYIEINQKDLSVKYNDELIISGTVNSLELNKLDIDFKSEDKEESFKGNIKYINENGNLKSNINFEFTTETIAKLNIEINNNKVNEKEYNSNIIFALEVDSQKIELTNTMKTMLGKEIASNEVSNTINYNDLTENDLITIEENLYNKLESTKLGEFINLNNNLDDSLLKETFMTQANVAISEASDAAALIEIGSLSSRYFTKENINTYCFTINDLINAGFLPKESYTNITGTITVTKTSNGYIYNTQLKDENYFVQKSDGAINVSDIDGIEYLLSSSFKYDCKNNYMN